MSAVALIAARTQTSWEVREGPGANLYRCSQTQPKLVGLWREALLPSNPNGSLAASSSPSIGCLPIRAAGFPKQPVFLFAREKLGCQVAAFWLGGVAMTLILLFLELLGRPVPRRSPLAMFVLCYFSIGLNSRFASGAARARRKRRAAACSRCAARNRWLLGLKERMLPWLAPAQGVSRKAMRS
jgi:hypothetical protein